MTESTTTETNTTLVEVDTPRPITPTEQIIDDLQNLEEWVQSSEKNAPF